jgi:hypothetical protein
MLEGTRNRGIFNQAKKATYHRWLKNPGGPVKGNAPQELNKDHNDQQAALAKFQLDQGCIYCKAEQHGNTLFHARYVALDSNAFEIITKEYRGI